MASFIISLLGIAILGIMLDIINCDKNSMINFIFDLLVLLVIISNIVKLFNFKI